MLTGSRGDANWGEPSQQAAPPTPNPAFAE